MNHDNRIAELSDLDIEQVSGGNPLVRFVVSASGLVYKAGYAAGQAIYEATHK